ncbi:MCE family protein [Nocardioides daejeonensis]|uniref:MCE family protein n=1 Tax=Nocardioides daejeonensis TaxID=1046556 RepID=UPI0013A5AC65|nr:MCE family protein [Nocardioides daejeonensis]
MSFGNLNVRILGAGLVLALLLGAFFVVGGDDGKEKKTVTAHFPRAVSIYPGSEVRILGVTVGKVLDVVPDGDSVRVEMEYDSKYAVPADAQAVIVTPTLVADRFVQLTPAYEGGPKLEDGGEIVRKKTGVPVELDRIYAGLQDLARTLGPNGVNKEGTLNSLLTRAAKALDGRGVVGNKMLHDLSAAAETFANGSGDLFETVSNLAEFSSVLAANDKLVTAFLGDLATVSKDLADEREELSQALASVARAVGTVRGFVHDNRKQLAGNVKRLTKVAKAFSAERASIERALRTGPVALQNLNIAFDAETGTIGSRIGVKGNLADVDGFLCGVIQQTGMPRALANTACQLFKALLEPLGKGISDMISGPGKPEARIQEVGQRVRVGDGTTTSLDDLVGAR